MNVAVDIAHYEKHGWVRAPGAVPVKYCQRVADAMEREAGVPVHDPSRWGEYGGPMRDLVPLWGHQAQWDIRQHPNLRAIWSALWRFQALWVSLDSCRFTPPWKPGHAEPCAIHWDHNPHDAAIGYIQGVLALTDTAADQGGFRCVPSLHQDRSAWPTNADGEGDWVADMNGREIIHVPAAAGDLILWNSRLAHSNSKNLSAQPRLAFYVSMYPARAKDMALRDACIESWRSGRCVSWWRDRHGYDRVEPWASASLTTLGRRLLGLDPW